MGMVKADSGGAAVQRKFPWALAMRLRTRTRSSGIGIGSGIGNGFNMAPVGRPRTGYG